jgi:serine/threonine protein kinase
MLILAVLDRYRLKEQRHDQQRETRQEVFLMSAGPKRLGKYELQEVMGRGGMAEVWKGFDPQLKRYVAIKFMHTNLRSDPDFMNRFLREGQAIAALRHPNIVQVYDFHILAISIISAIC